MKKLIFILPLLSLQFISHAQTSQGRVIVGASVYYENQQTVDYDAVGSPNGAQQTYSNLTLTVQPGYFISDNFCLGLSAVYMDNTESLKNPPVSGEDTKSITWEYGLYARHYIKITDRFYFTNSFVMTLKTGTNNSTIYSSPPPATEQGSLAVKGYYFSYAPGVIYFISSHFGIKTNIGTISYEHTTTTVTSGYASGTSNTYGVFSIISPLTSFNVGVDFFIGK